MSRSKMKEGPLSKEATSRLSAVAYERKRGNPRDNSTENLIQASFYQYRHLDGPYLHILVRNNNNIVGSWTVTTRSWIATLGVVLPGIYGGVHLSALHFEFPTKVESLLWKLSCICIMTNLPLLGLIELFHSELKIRSWSNILSWWKPSRLSFPALEILQMAVACIAWSIYVCARLFIVTESFISLRKMPVGVYWIPAWLQMLPHA